MQSVRTAFSRLNLPHGMQSIDLSWALTIGVLVLDAVWVSRGGWSISRHDAWVVLIAVAGFHAPLAIRRYRSDLRLRTTLQAAALLITFQASAATLSYLVISTDAPLVDTRLAAWDSALGFDWLAACQWLRARPAASAILQFAYDSGMAQLLVAVLFLGFSKRPAQLAEFMRLFIAATLWTIVLSGAFPAEGAWKHYGVGGMFDVSTLSHFESLRSGSKHDIALGRMQGLISIPSLHAAMAVLLVYALRGTRLVSLFLGLNIAMLLATPIDGGHYLVDVLAGVMQSLALIAVSRSRVLRTDNKRPYVANVPEPIAKRPCSPHVT